MSLSSQERLGSSIQMESESEVSQSCPTLATTWIVAYQARSSMGFSRQGYWSGLPFPSLGGLPDPGIEPSLRIVGRRFTV